MVQVFLSVKCHRLCSLKSFAFLFIRQVAVSWLSAAVTYTVRSSRWGHLRAFRRTEIITVADSSYFVYARYHRISYTFWLFCIHLLYLRGVWTHLGTTLTSVSSAYSTSFCETVTHITDISSCISSAMWPVLAGDICWELFSRKLWVIKCKTRRVFAALLF